MLTTVVSYTLVTLRGGQQAVYASAYGEIMHPVAGPATEAEALHVAQLKLRERFSRHDGEFVVWDVGLGAAANVLAVLRAARNSTWPLRLVSFDDTLEPLAFALTHSDALGYLRGYEPAMSKVLEIRSHEFTDGEHAVRWEIHSGDFPALVASAAGASLPKPHAILFDPFSPAKNPAMWTLPVFENLFRLLDPHRACALTTYSRSTLVRVTLLLAGFFVGRGRPSGVKEETTAAANRLELLDEPLDTGWLQRARRSGSAEPLSEASYRQLPLSAETWARLRAHQQFTNNPR